MRLRVYTRRYSVRLENAHFPMREKRMLKSCIDNAVVFCGVFDKSHSFLLVYQQENEVTLFLRFYFNLLLYWTLYSS